VVEEVSLRGRWQRRGGRSAGALARQAIAAARSSPSEW